MWLEENQVKSLVDCKSWKDSNPMLPTEVAGIKTLDGFGCTVCNYCHDRRRSVTAHMQQTHGFDKDTQTVSCSIQGVFSSHLRGWWRVETATYAEDINDEGIMALSYFSAEFKQLEQEDTRSAVGTLYCQTVKLISSSSS